MYKGMYIAVTGAALKQKHMDIFAQNISNSNTTGFKKDRISFRDYLIPTDNATSADEKSRTMVQLSEQVTDFSSGPTQHTGNPLDLAINGKGFFALEHNRYTRNGNFKIGPDGFLATQDNIKVLGDGGPLAIEGGKINISTSGEVHADGISIGTIQVVDFDDKSKLQRLDGGHFYSKDSGQEINSTMNQGYLETSNVEVLREMVQMVTSLREFETYQKMIHVFDEAASKTINEMGR